MLDEGSGDAGAGGDEDCGEGCPGGGANPGEGEPEGDEPGLPEDLHWLIGSDEDDLIYAGVETT